MAKNKYVMGLNRSGMPKSDMIDYIAGVFSNNATKYSCLKFVGQYFDEKAVEDIADEVKLRRLLKNSTEKTVRNIYELCIQEHKHLSQYREDNLPKRPVGVARGDGFRYADGNVVGGGFNKNFVTFEQFNAEDMANIKTDFNDISNDLVNKLTDIEDQLKVYVSEYEIDDNFHSNIMEQVKTCQRYVSRAIYNVSEKLSFDRPVKKVNEDFNSQKCYLGLQNDIMSTIEFIDGCGHENERFTKCKEHLQKCLNILVSGHKEQF